VLKPILLPEQRITRPGYRLAGAPVRADVFDLAEADANVGVNEDHGALLLRVGWSGRPIVRFSAFHRRERDGWPSGLGRGRPKGRPFWFCGCVGVRDRDLTS